MVSFTSDDDESSTSDDDSFTSGEDDGDHKHVFKESPCKSRNAICILCVKKVPFESNAYYCRGCRYNFHKDCLTITYTKTHEHTLTFIRRNIKVSCDACGQDYDRMHMYACLQCDFYIHRYCIFLPKAIKITRHPHRLSQTLRIPGRRWRWRCQICRHHLYADYGGYTCTKERCDFVVHSLCATDRQTWDGKDLEGEPEEAELIDVGSLVEIDIRSAHHFSHEHNLTRVYVEGEEQVCEACILPIEFGSFLSCKQCNFALHNECASVPRRKESMLHLHPMILHTDTKKTNNGFFTCSVCNQYSCGFMYQCCQEDCGFKMDVKCASFVEPLNHVSHKNPLYMAKFGKEMVYRCSCCSKSSKFAVEAKIPYYNIFGFRLDFQCVNLPELVKYKYDDHLLTLQNRNTLLIESYSPFELCDICEEYIEDLSLRYSCHDDCGISIHVECILGKYLYLQIGHKIQVSGFKVDIASNNGVSRPSCRTCHNKCRYKLVFIGRDAAFFCSFECIH